MPPITSTKSKSSKSSRFPKRKEMKKNVELEKIMSDRAVELAQYEAEMEKKKCILKWKRRKWLAQLAEKEYDLLSLEDADSASNYVTLTTLRYATLTTPLPPFTKTKLTLFTTTLTNRTLTSSLPKKSKKMENFLF